MLGVTGENREREVQQEIETFLTALSSYPDRFARNPCISFEQHLFSLAAAKSGGQGPRSNSGRAVGVAGLTRSAPRAE